MSYLEVTDFTSEDRGRYRPADVEGFTADEIEAKIIAALTDSNGHDDGRAFRTLPRIKEHAELSKASDISEILFNMIEDGKIKKHENGDFTCYFLFNEKPKRFWRNGDGTVGAEFEDGNALHPFADKIGQPAVPAAYSQPILDQKPYSKQKIEIDPTALEEAMAKHGKMPAVAKELGIGYSTLYTKVNAQPQLQAALKRGNQRFEAVQAAKKTERREYFQEKIGGNPQKQEENMSIATAPAKAATETAHAHSPKGIAWSEELFRDAHNRGESQSDLARRVGVAGPSVGQQLKRNPVFKAAFYGVSVEEVQNAAPERKPKIASIIKPENDLLTKLEEYAFEGLTIPKAAEKVGMSFWSLKDNIRGKIKDKSIKEAWERGLVRRKKELNNLSNDIEAAETPETRTDRHDREIAEVAIDEIGPNPETSTEEPQRSIALDPQEIQANEPGHTGAETTEEETTIAAPELAPSFEGPIKSFNQSVDPFSEPASDKPFHSIRIRNIKAEHEEPDNLPSFDRPTSIMKEIFDIQREAAAEFSQAPVSTRFLPFGKEGEIILGFEGNYFDLTKDERRFLETIADRLDGYGKPTPRKRTMLQRFADWMANL